MPSRRVRVLAIGNCKEEQIFCGKLWLLLAEGRVLVSARGVALVDAMAHAVRNGRWRTNQPRHRSAFLPVIAVPLNVSAASLATGLSRTAEWCWSKNNLVGTSVGCGNCLCSAAAAPCWCWRGTECGSPPTLQLLSQVAFDSGLSVESGAIHAEGSASCDDFPVALKYQR